jgi:hypothetical protein
MLHLYEQKSQSRDELVQESRRAVLELAKAMEKGICDHPEAEQLVWELAQQLETTTGKKTYGYLPKPQKVLVDKILIYTRADFPHDNWWKQISLTFSNGDQLCKALEKSRFAHVITFEEKEITWVKLHDLIKADDPSPFPALTQIEVYGKEVTK